MRREFAIHMARKTEWLAVLLFYVIVASLFPIALGSWPHASIWLAPIILWVSVLISSVLAQETLLRTDFKLGVYDQVLLSKHALSLIMLAKICVHWLLYAGPIIIVTPLLALSFALPPLSILVITLSLILGSMCLSLLAALGAAITVRLARGGVLLAMLILPLYIPVLVLGCDIGVLSVQGVVSSGHFALLMAVLLSALLSVPWAVAATIKVSME